MKMLIGTLEEGLLSLVILLNIHMSISVLTSGNEDEILLAMNFFRGSVVPSAANMQPLVSIRHNLASWTSLLCM